MEGEPDNKNRITKTEKELEQSKNIDEYGKRSYEEAV